MFIRWGRRAAEQVGWRQPSMLEANCVVH